MAKLTVTIDSENPYVKVESIHSGITAVKSVTVDEFCTSMAQNVHIGGFQSGILPPGCISLTANRDSVQFLLLCGFNRCDITYHDTVYRNFPLPCLVVGAKMDSSGRLSGFRLGVIANELPAPNTQMYHYPFSNVSEDGGLCVGSNTFHGYDSLWKLRTLPHRLLSITNNDDQYSEKNSQLNLPYRALLEHLKDKDTSYYYEKVLIPNGKTLKDFI